MAEIPHHRAPHSTDRKIGHLQPNVICRIGESRISQDCFDLKILKWLGGLPNMRR
jgi:hypothetical protein